MKVRPCRSESVARTSAEIDNAAARHAADCSTDSVCQRRQRAPASFYRMGRSGQGRIGSERYDHETDPREMSNLALRAGHAPSVRELSRPRRKRIADAGIKPDGAEQMASYRCPGDFRCPSIEIREIPSRGIRSPAVVLLRGNSCARTAWFLRRRNSVSMPSASNGCLISRPFAAQIDLTCF